MRLALVVSLLTILIAFAVVPAQASVLYKWTDEDGNLHVATSLSEVPEKYRDRVTVIGAEESASPAATAKDAPSKDTVDDPSSVSEVPPELPRFEVPYTNEGSTRRIIIPVTFNDRVTAPMALDTGSPGLVISFELAVRLGAFSRYSGVLFTTASGIGGDTLAIRTIVDSVSVQRARSEFVPTTVVGPMSPEFDGLIGMDFLTHHTISIDSRKQVVVFQEVPPHPDDKAGHGEDWWRATFEEFRAARDYWDNLARSSNLRDGSAAKSAIEYQAQEARRLLLRLENYASDNAVPRHWR